MPKVGKKHYPYTHAGRRAAKEEANKRGLKVEYTESTYKRIAEKILEGRKYGSSPTETGRMAGEFMGKFKRSGATPDQIQDKRDQVNRIADKTQARQAKNYGRRNMLQGQGAPPPNPDAVEALKARGEHWAERDRRPTGEEIHKAAGERFGKAYRKAQYPKGEVAADTNRKRGVHTRSTVRIAPADYGDTFDRFTGKPLSRKQGMVSREEAKKRMNRSAGPLPGKQSKD